MFAAICLPIALISSPQTCPPAQPCSPEPCPPPCHDPLAGSTCACPPPTCDPSIAGQSGSNNSGYAAGTTTSRWSFWINPSHPGVGVLDGGSGSYFDPGSLGTPAESGLGQQTFGETAVDAYPLIDHWNLNGLTPPVACWDSPGVDEDGSNLCNGGHWSIKTWTVTSVFGGADFVYRRRTVVLPSGVALTIFRPFIGEPGGDLIPPDLTPSQQTTYAQHYKADAYVFLSAYQGLAYGVVRNPEIWRDYTVQDAPYPYDGCDNGVPKPFGIEFNPQGPFINLPDVDLQAFRRGMTVVFVQPGCGVRPLFAAISQLIEVGAWLDGPKIGRAHV